MIDAWMKDSAPCELLENELGLKTDAPAVAPMALRQCLAMRLQMMLALCVKDARRCALCVSLLQ